MKKNLQILLQLDGLVLTRKGLELTGIPIRKEGMDDLDQKIEKLRRRLPAEVVSHYDRLARQYADPLSMLAGDVCQGCQQRISRRAIVLAGRSHEVIQCEHCGRFIFARTNAPDYVT